MRIKLERSFLLDGFLSGAFGLASNIITNQKNDKINAQQLAHDSSINEANLEWQREQYYNDVAIADRRRKEDMERQDTELERALEQAKKSGVSPLAILGTGLGAGVVGGNTSAGGYAGSSATSNMIPAEAYKFPSLGFNDTIQNMIENKRVDNEIRKVDDARDLNNRMLEVDKSQFDANQKYLYDKLQSEVQIAAEHNESNEAISKLTRESVEYCTRYQVAVEKGISMAQLEEHKAEYYKDLELKKQEMVKKYGLEAQKIDIMKSDSKSKRMNAIATMIGSCGIAIKGIGDAATGIAGSLLKKTIGFHP